MKSKHKYWAVLTASTLGLSGLAFAANLGSEKYIYDGSGNIVEKSIDGQVTKMSFDASNKVTSVSSSIKEGVQVTYDAAGRPTAYKDCEGNVTRQLKYGYAGKVVRAHNTGHEANFFYNAEGQLVGNCVAGETTSYAWDGNVLAAEGAEAFTNEAHITGGVPAMAGDQAVLVSDYLGNTLSQGAKQFNSTAYGEGVEQGRFTGKSFVEQLGSYVFHHRLYSPETLRWSTKDPTGFPDGINNSLYVCGDPVSKLDPLGTSEVHTTEDSNRVNPNGSPSVIVRYTYKYGKYQEPEVTTGSASFPPGSGWIGATAVITCNESMPSPVPTDGNKLYWKNTHENNTDTLFVTVGGTNSSQIYSTPYAMDSPEFEK
jgi:RHS repeat-associated protein